MFVPITPLEFRRRAERLFGSKIGVIDGERRFTYAEFGERSRRLASALRGLGVAHGEVVSFLTYNTHHLLEAYYGVLQAGAVLNPINIRLHPREIAYVLNHAGSRALFFHRDFIPVLEAIRADVQTVQEFVAIEPDGNLPDAAREYEGLLTEAPPQAADPEVDENSAAELFYTSGTTGRPKGVVLTHRALYLHALYAAVAKHTTDETVHLHVVPMFHVNGWGAPHTVTATGGTHVLLRKIDPVEIFRLIEKERITSLYGVPSIYNALVNHPRAAAYDLSSLRVVIAGGAPASPALITAIEEKLGCRAFVGYGLTETSPVLTLAWPKGHLRHEPPERQLERRSRTGYPILGVDVRVVDARGRDVPADGTTAGEIIARSNVVMEGYFKDPRATAEAIREGWFHTGDIATVDAEGYVNIVDRKKDIIISGGENISSVEVENALFAHPAVYECAVLAVPDEQWGEVPKALVVLKPGAAATADELILFCRERLAHFKVPKSVEFSDALPKSGTGKILKAELREKYWVGQVKRVH
ncbi:MAG TPA: fatty acid--CoA ligase [bacterium]|nr:fatty acid--CoA ligase [bacterium]